MKLVILGIQGSGKGTQGKLIAEKYGLKHLSAGNLLRAEIQKKSEEGKQLQAYVNNGLLAPHELTNKIMAKNIPEDNYLLDGYPRDTEQSKFLEKINPPKKIIFLELPEQEVFHRLGSRLQCSKCGMIFGLNNLKQAGELCNKCKGKLVKRKDDTKEAIKTRIKEFKKETLPLLKFYKSRVIKINGNQSVEDVFKEIKKALED